MKNENDDLIVITRANNGHYLYFNPMDDRDKGNIYSFCKNRGVKIADLLNEKGGKGGLEVKDLSHKINPSSLNDKAIEALNTFKELKELDEGNNFFVLKRFIDEETLKHFDKLKEDKFHNVCAPTFILDKCKDIDFVNMAGFMSYLKCPMCLSFLSNGVAPNTFFIELVSYTDNTNLSGLKKSKKSGKNFQKKRSKNVSS